MKADRRGCPPSPGRGRRARPAPVGRRSRTPAGGRRRRRDPRAWAGRGGLGASEWVEPQLFELMDHPDIAHRDLSSLRAITHAGASAPPTLRRRARERLGAVLAHVYGASETGIVSALSPAEHDLARPNLFSCAGGIHPGVDVRFRRNDGTLADPGETGSIQMRFPAMAGGYRNARNLHADVWTARAGAQGRNRAHRAMSPLPARSGHQRQDDQVMASQRHPARVCVRRTWMNSSARTPSSMPPIPSGEGP